MLAMKRGAFLAAMNHVAHKFFASLAVAALGVVCASVALAATANIRPRPKPPPAGSLVQLPGASGCITTTGLSGCASSPVLKGASDVKISPDGRFVYVASRYSNAVVEFERTATGGLTAWGAPGWHLYGCASSDGSKGLCQQANDLRDPVSLAISSDSRYVYVASRLSGTIEIFVHGPLGGDDLSYWGNHSHCINSHGTDGCAASAPFSLNGITSIAIAGAFVYAATPAGIGVFRRDALYGALTYLSCLGPAAGCAPFPNMPPTPAVTPVAVTIAGSTLLVGATTRVSGKPYPLFFQAALSPATGQPLRGSSDPCYADAAVPLTLPLPCEREFSSLSGDMISMTVSVDQSAVLTSIRSTSSQLADLQGFDSTNSGRFYPSDTAFGWDPGSSPGIFSPDKKYIYTPDFVACLGAGPYAPNGLTYGECAQVRVGKPQLANGTTNVIPTAMAMTTDGSDIYLTYGTPSAPHTKLGGIYALRPVR